MPKKYYLMIDDERKGPYLQDQLLEAGLQWETMVWFKGCADWQPAHEVPELVGLFSDPPPAPRYDREDDASFDLRKRFPEAYLRKPYRFGFVVYQITCALLLIGAIAAIAAFAIERGPNTWRRDWNVIHSMAAFAWIACGLFAILGLIAGALSFLILLYRCWNVIQDGQTTTSPGAAVGLLFVPVFQLFWIFRAMAGLAGELNRFADRHRLVAPRASVLLGTTIPIYTIIALIPIAGTGASILNVVLIPLFMRSIYRTARCFCEENETRADDATPAPGLTWTGIIAGGSAILLGVIGFSCVGIASMLLPINYASHEQLVDSVERSQLRLAELERFPFHQQGEPLRREIAGLRSSIDWQQRSIPQVNASNTSNLVTLGIGFFCSIFAIVLALIARHGNARLGAVLPSA